MEKKLEKQLMDQFPSFFVDMYGDPKETTMHWGIAFNKGWFKIIYEFCKNVSSLGEIGFKFVQLKEKFASMRVYYDLKSKDKKIQKKVNKFVRIAEEESGKTCENCGTKEKVTTEGRIWLQTLCKNCRTEEIH
jgi:hypothetical protein